MRNPVKSLFYQYYWWQACSGHKEMPATVAILFILLNLLFYVDSFISLIQFFVFNSTEAAPFVYI
ncbi:MAG: hypothetical protein K2H15_06000, partial [Muribaculaceae bacterium]|nr:hypothetical protein [Muribaculaceae bacterium]